MIHEIVIYGVLYSNSTNTVFAGSFAFNSKFSDSEPTEIFLHEPSTRHAVASHPRQPISLTITVQYLI